MFQTIVIIILLILVLYVLFRIIKTIVKTVVFFLIILLFLSGTLSLLMYMDVKDLKDNFWEKDKLLVLEGDGPITGAIVQSLGTNRSKDMSFKVLSPARIESMGPYSELSNFTRVLVLHRDFFTLLPENVEFEEMSIKLDREDLQNLLEDSEPLEYYLDKYPGKDRNTKREKILEDFNTPEDFRAGIFILSSLKVMERAKMPDIYLQYKEGNIEVYPRTIFFALADILPGFLVRIILFFIF